MYPIHMEGLTFYSKSWFTHVLLAKGVESMLVGSFQCSVQTIHC